MARMTLEEALEMRELTTAEIPSWVNVEEVDAHPHDDEPSFYISGMTPVGEFADGILSGDTLEDMLALYEGADNVTLTVSLPLL